MKKLSFLLFILLPLFTIAQTVNEQFVGYANIASVTSLGGGLYTVGVTAFVGSPRFEINGTWVASDVAVNDVIFVDGARHIITIVNSAGGSTMNVRVNNIDEGLGVSALTNGSIVAIGREFSTGLFPMPRQGDGSGNGVPPALASSIEVHNAFITNALGNDYITTDSFATFSPTTTFAAIPIGSTVWSTTRGSTFQKTNSTTMTRRSYENGQMASTIFNQSGTTLLFNANLNNRSQLIVPVGSTVATISAPTNIATQSIGEIYEVCIQNNAITSITVNWNTVFGKWDMTDVVTTLTAGTTLCYQWITVTDGVEGVVLASMNDLGGGTDITILNTAVNATLATETAAFVDCTAGTITITLPSPVTNSKRAYEVVKTDVTANPIRLSGTFSSGTERLVYDNSIFVRSNGTSWYVSKI